LIFYSFTSIRRLLIENILLIALSSLTMLAAVLLSRKLIESTQALSSGMYLLSLFFLLRVADVIIGYILRMRAVQMHRALQTSLYYLLFGKLLRLESNIASFSKGQLKVMMGADINAIEDFVSVLVSTVVPSAVVTLIVAPALYSLIGTAGLLALAVALALVPLASVGTLLSRYLQRRAQAAQDSVAGLAGEWVKNIRLVRFLGWQDSITQDLIRRMQRYVRLSALRHCVVILVFSTSFHWAALPLLSIFAYAYYVDQSLGLLQIFSAFWLVDHLMSHLSHVPHALSQLGAAWAAAERLSSLLRLPELERFLLPAPEVAHQPQAAQVLKFSHIILREVSVVFDRSTVLSELSLEISLQQRTAIVGKVGSGKSTLLELLIGERHPTHGSIELRLEDGTLVPLWRSDVYRAYRQQLAYVPQQPFISNSSLRENIDFSSLQSNSELEQAVTAAQLTRDIQQLPRGLQQEIGEAGINLSGGQKQRVNLARAFLSQRDFFVLDDPLSAVDGRTEAALAEMLFSRAGGLVLVSHRLGELHRCDRVLVLATGRLVEDGEPACLEADRSSRYHRFLQELADHE
jgi:ATP-binding cassette subfamily C protein CydD